MKHIYSFFAMAFGLLSASASAQFTDGIFVLNEGGAGSNNASVSYISNATGALQNNVFATANPSAGAMGDTAQSLGFNGNYIYIVLNISNTVRILDRSTLQLVATVSTGLNNPRYMAFADGKAFITNWGSGTSTTDDYLAVLNLQTNAIENTISLPEGVERVAVINDKLYVLHQGGYGYGNTVSVVDAQTQTLVDTIAVGDVPNSFYVENNFLYVLCGGSPFWAPNPSSGGLYKIDLSTNDVVGSTTWSGMNPAHLESDGSGHLYFTNDADIYAGDLANLGTSATSIISLGSQGAYGIYGMDLIDGKLYVADAGNYVSPGTAYVYTTAGTAVTNYQVGVIPNGFYKAENYLSVPNPDKPLALFAYPNPTSDKLYVNSDEIATLALYDVSGRKVLEQNVSNQISANVSNLQSGQYIARLSSGKAYATAKIIIK